MQAPEQFRLREVGVSKPGSLPNFQVCLATIGKIVIVASAVNEQGEELYPPKWNHEFIDLPEIKNQNTPTFSIDDVTGIVATSEGQFLRFWIGHADKNVTDGYSKVEDDVAFGQLCEANVGLGFELPAENQTENPMLHPNAPNCTQTALSSAVS